MRSSTSLTLIGLAAAAALSYVLSDLAAATRERRRHSRGVVEAGVKVEV